MIPAWAWIAGVVFWLLVIRRVRKLRRERAGSGMLGTGSEGGPRWMDLPGGFF